MIRWPAASPPTYRSCSPFRRRTRRDLAYEPHITLARYAEIDKLEAALAEAEDEFGDELGDVIREVTLVSVEGSGKIIPLKTIALDTA